MTAKEMEQIANEANLSQVQTEMLSELCRGDLYNYGISMEMHMSPRSFYRKKKAMDEKCERVIEQIGARHLLAQK
jgi:hypothetical protein